MLSIKLPEVRQQLVPLFKSISRPTQIKSQENFVYLGWIMHEFLDAIEIRETNTLGQLELESVMSVSLHLYLLTEDGRSRKRLSSEIDQHKIFLSVDMWQYTVEAVIKSKLFPMKNESDIKETTLA